MQDKLDSPGASAVAPASAQKAASQKRMVTHFREIVLWPLQVIPKAGAGGTEDCDVLYRPIYELTQFMIQGYEHRDAKRPGSLATRFQAAAAASTMAS